MTTQHQDRSGGKQPQAAESTDTKGKKVPNTDMQAEDAGTADSGNGGSADAAGKAMKQTSKTPAQR